MSILMCENVKNEDEKSKNQTNSDREFLWNSCYIMRGSTACFRLAD